MAQAAMTAGRPFDTIDEDFWTFFRNSHVALYLAAPDGALIDINSAGVRLLGGETATEFLRARTNIFALRRRPEDRRAFAAMLEKSAPGSFIRSHVITRARREIAVEECASRTSATRIIGAMSRPQILSGAEVSERDVMERDLARAKLEVERANRFKSEFLANLSHELRTPLNGIIGGADIISARESDETSKQFAAVIRQSGEQLLALIDNILELSKIESGHLAAQFEVLDLADFVADIERSVRPLVEAKGLRFVVKTAPDAPEFLDTDGAKLRRILDNLLHNALKFTHAGGVAFGVDVSYAEDGSGALYCVVRDTGCGIAQIDIDRMFTPFEQLNGASSRRYAGVGVGLTLSTRLADLIGGRLSVSSVEGEGSIFTLRLPLAARAEEPAAAQNAETAIVSAPSGDILVVDDVPMNVMVAGELLKRLGFSAITASTGADAVERLRAGGVRAVLMDVSMPDMDGVAATAAIRALGGAAGATPIIAVTANVFDGDRERYLEAGMNGYVSKPVTARALKAELDRILGA